MSDPGVILGLAFRILVAMVLGAAIGMERQWRLRTAGIRTNALVSVGASLFVVMGAVGLGTDPGADPTRVAAQVVSGIGFLGAGVILRDGVDIRGLTTAATLWCAAAVGSLAGAGMEVMAVIGCVAIIATNTLLRPLGRFVNGRQRQAGSLLQQADDEDVPTDFMLEVVTTDKSESRIRALVLQAVDRPEYRLRSLDIRPGKSSQTKVMAGVSAQHAGDTAGLEVAVQRIGLDPKVTSSRWWPAETDD
ncbi:MgtC/SapB family protein [Streptomyces africanus]|uniref:MgtC/SapB family protein n=1 Tax=Streptomyces africanus TaxID=231024 RepID=UPI001FC9954E|nr:MgtC/SapB family protein [Streptomyces africanus]